MADKSNSLSTALARCRTSFLAVIIFSFGINLLMLAIPIYMLQLINNVIPNRSTDTLLLLTGIVLSGLLVLSTLETIRDRILVRIGYWLDEQIGGDVLGATSCARCGADEVLQFKDCAILRPCAAF
jgi:ATP-binding cassette subfamily B protein/ATP-binding cassette subfamily C protein